MAKINVIVAIVNREDVASADVLTLYWVLDVNVNKLLSYLDQCLRVLVRSFAIADPPLLLCCCKWTTPNNVLNMKQLQFVHGKWSGLSLTFISYSCRCCHERPDDLFACASGSFKAHNKRCEIDSHNGILLLGTLWLHSFGWRGGTWTRTYVWAVNGWRIPYMSAK